MGNVLNRQNSDQRTEKKTDQVQNRVQRLHTKENWDFVANEKRYLQNA